MKAPGTYRFSAEEVTILSLIKCDECGTDGRRVSDEEFPSCEWQYSPTWSENYTRDKFLLSNKYPMHPGTEPFQKPSAFAENSRPLDRTSYSWNILKEASILFPISSPKSITASMYWTQLANHQLRRGVFEPALWVWPWLMSDSMSLVFRYGFLHLACLRHLGPAE